MKCLILRPKSKLRLSDATFLAKAPLLPNQRLFQNEGFNLGLLQSDAESPLLLISDHEDFLKQYRNYYEERFEVEEKGEDFVVPSAYQVIFGKVQFDNETPEEPADELEEELEEEES
jgi:hypothetical protein